MLPKASFLYCLMVMSLLGPKVWAHPPSDIELSYDHKKKNLHIEMRHTTHDPREDFIRKLEIQKNQEDMIVRHYTIQVNTINFIEDIALEAQENDTITIKAYSREGGSSTATLRVKAGEEVPESKGEEKATPQEENIDASGHPDSKNGGY